MNDCIFCKIVKQEQPTDFLYEDEYLVVLKDINPAAPVHLLIVPKKHIESINHCAEENKDLIGQIILVAKQMAQEQGVAKSGYKLIFNVGRGGGQLVDHVHLHLMGGWQKIKN